MAHPPASASFLRLAAVLLVLGAAGLPGATVPSGSAVGADLKSLLDGVEARLKAGFTYRAWTADSLTIRTDLDKDGRPEKVTRISKIVRSQDGVRAERILTATETENGREADVTAKHAEEQREREEKERRRREEEARKGTAGGRRRSGSFDLDEILPFAADKRSAYDFRLRPAGPSSAPLVLEARAKDPSDKAWNGVYTIDPDRFDILRAEVRPAKNPRFVKELWAEADIERLPDGLLFIRRTKLKVDGGFLIKHIRMIVEDVYTNPRIL
jgi:hypothetical protein